MLTFNCDMYYVHMTHFSFIQQNLSTIFNTQGPFVLVDELMDTISQSSIPELPSTPLGQAGGSGSGRILGAKRRRDELEDGSEEGGVAPPTNDIYISRQQKRVQNHQ